MKNGIGADMPPSNAIRLRVFRFTVATATGMRGLLMSTLSTSPVTLSGTHNAPFAFATASGTVPAAGVELSEGDELEARVGRLLEARHVGRRGRLRRPEAARVGERERAQPAVIELGIDAAGVGGARLGVEAACVSAERKAKAAVVERHVRAARIGLNDGRAAGISNRAQHLQRVANRVDRVHVRSIDQHVVRPAAGGVELRELLQRRQARLHQPRVDAVDREQHALAVLGERGRPRAERHQRPALLGARLHADHLAGGEAGGHQVPLAHAVVAALRIGAGVAAGSAVERVAADGDAGAAIARNRVAGAAGAVARAVLAERRLVPSAAAAQAPQFFGSLSITTHWPSQSEVPARQRQALSTQTWLEAQAWPQAPQLRLSVTKSAQPVPQRWCRCGRRRLIGHPARTTDGKDSDALHDFLSGTTSQVRPNVRYAPRGGSG